MSYRCSTPMCDGEACPGCRVFNRKTDRRTRLAAAALAASQGEHDLARALFATCGISYVPLHPSTKA